MDINSLSYLYTSGLAGLYMPNQNGLNQLNQDTSGGQGNLAMDSYIPSSMNMAIPTTTYGPNGMMVGQTMQMQPVGELQENSALETENKADADFMQTLQEAFRANADSIQSTMDELGLTMEDLSSESNLTTLANAMNEGAEKIGVKTVDNLDQVISNLVDQINGADSDVSETSSASEGSEASASGGNGGSSSEEDETTTQIVTINGVTYLETTTTENGIETTTRTVLGSTTEV